MSNKKYHIITIGCAMNKADSERIAAFLESHAYQNSDSWEQADLIVMTTCGIRQSAEDRVYGLVNTMRKTNKKAALVITGCLSKRKDVMRRLIGQVDLFMPINELPNLFDLLKKSKPEKVLSLDDIRELSGEKYLAIAPKHDSGYTACVPIGNGCNNFCSYCVVPYARGREVYRPASEIINEVKSLVAKGYKEIFLIAQNVNSYKSGAYDFPKLLIKLSKISGRFWIRFTSSHPKDLSDELIAAFASSDKICSHLHLALQSGDDEILTAMNRKYTASHFEEIINKVREAKPGVAITTDVIVGFPGETKKQFNNTVKIFKKLKFDLAYCSKYSPRPGTVSWKMKDDVSREEKSERDKILVDIISKTGLAANKKYIGREVEVLVDKINKKGKIAGKTSSYKDVFFTSDKYKASELIGRFVKVKITKARDLCLEGELVAIEG
jgi:tRNA-2-methylthio-N6-dimethylallyladenosine synthase